MGDTGSIPGAVSGAQGRDAARRLRRRASQASNRALAYVKEEPVKTLLIAAAAGALFMGLLTLMARSDD